MFDSRLAVDKQVQPNLDIFLPSSASFPPFSPSFPLVVSTPSTAMALPFGAHVPFEATQNVSPLSFGFGLGVPQHHMPPPAPAPETIVQQPQPEPQAPQRPSVTPRSSTKRRLEVDDEDDAAMDGGRSPSPAERPMRRLATKKMRMIPVSRGQSVVEEDDAVDVGSLLASLPPSSLLPLLTSLINERPELKPVVLNLIPRPTLETAIQAINAGAKKLREAYPYAHPSTLGFGFGAGQQSQSAQPGANAMRDSYVRTRLRQPVKDFTKLLMSYMSYFSSTPSNNNGQSSSQPNGGASSSSQRAPTVPLHPTETFTFLHNLTLHMLRFPPLTLAEFVRPTENVVFPRLQAELSAWVQNIDDDVNRWGRMYRDDDVKAWERGLDELVAAEENCVRQGGQEVAQGYIGMRAIRDRWVSKVGWLIGRRAGSVGMEL